MTTTLRTTSAGSTAYDVGQSTGAAYVEPYAGAAGVGSGAVDAGMDATAQTVADTLDSVASGFEGIASSIQDFSARMDGVLRRDERREAENKLESYRGFLKDLLQWAHPEGVGATERYSLSSLSDARSSMGILSWSVPLGALLPDGTGRGQAISLWSSRLVRCGDLWISGVGMDDWAGNSVTRQLRAAMALQLLWRGVSPIIRGTWERVYRVAGSDPRFVAALERVTPEFGTPQAAWSFGLAAYVAGRPSWIARYVTDWNPGALGTIESGGVVQPGGLAVDYGGGNVHRPSDQGGPDRSPSEGRGGDSLHETAPSGTAPAVEQADMVTAVKALTAEELAVAEPLIREVVAGMPEGFPFDTRKLRMAYWVGCMHPLEVAAVLPEIEARVLSVPEAERGGVAAVVVAQLLTCWLPHVLLPAVTGSDAAQDIADSVAWASLFIAVSESAFTWGIQSSTSTARGVYQVLDDVAASHASADAYNDEVCQWLISRAGSPAWRDLWCPLLILARRCMGLDLRVPSDVPVLVVVGWKYPAIARDGVAALFQGVSGADAASIQRRQAQGRQAWDASTALALFDVDTALRVLSRHALFAG